MYHIVYIHSYMYHLTICHMTYLYSCVYVSRDIRSHDLPEGLSLASEVNLQTVDMSILDHSLNWDHHCSTATANGGGGGGEREKGREGGREGGREREGERERENNIYNIHVHTIMIFIVFTTNPEAKYIYNTPNIQPQFLKLNTFYNTSC